MNRCIRLIHLLDRRRIGQIAQIDMFIGVCPDQMSALMDFLHNLRILLHFFSQQKKRGAHTTFLQSRKKLLRIVRIRSVIKCNCHFFCQFIHRHRLPGLCWHTQGYLHVKSRTTPRRHACHSCCHPDQSASFLFIIKPASCYAHLYSDLYALSLRVYSEKREAITPLQKVLT